MCSKLHRLAFVVTGLAVLACGCVCPRPQSFTDATALPSDFVGESYRAYAERQRLVIEVSQIPGLNVVAFDEYVQDGVLYLSPRRISSGGGGIRKFEIDVSKYHFGQDWPTHVYWLVEGPYWYPIGHAGFWSSAHRDPWVRKRMEVAVK
jgi:hypothetical protein